MSNILVVDDELYIRDLLRSALSMKGHNVVTCPSAGQSLELVSKGSFDLILLDIEIAGESGISVLRAIRETSRTLPVVVYSGAVTSELEKEAMEAGANEVLSKTVEIPELVERIEKIAAARDRIFEGSSKRKEKTVLLVDDEAAIRNMLKSFFRSKGFNTIEASSGEEAVRISGTGKFSVALLDMNMAGIDGLETLKRLLEINPKLGVVMVTSDQDDEKIRKAIALGAYGYVLKPFDFLYLELVVMSKLVIADNG